MSTPYKDFVRKNTPRLHFLDTDTKNTDEAQIAQLKKLVALRESELELSRKENRISKILSIIALIVAIIAAIGTYLPFLIALF